MADETAGEEEPPAEAQHNEHVKAFFLAFAAKGKDAWNAWRSDPANKDVRVIFAGVDFSQPPLDQIDFSGFEFSNTADFSGCKWRGVALGKKLEHTREFTPGRSLFADAVFDQGADFTRAIFGNETSFFGAEFHGDTSFERARFYIGANFTNVKEFRRRPSFTGAEFDDQASFVGITFNDGAKFDETWFKGSVEFNSSRFKDVSFIKTRFDGEAVFSCTESFHNLNFRGAHFYFPPTFNGVRFAWVDFTGAHIGFVPKGKLLHWTEDSRVPLRLRAFRKIAEETKNHDLERDLYIEERKAERGVYWRQLSGLDELEKKLENITKQKKHVWLEWRLKRRARNARWLGLLANPAQARRLIVHCLWIAVMGVYWLLADYGRSFVRPIVCWLALTFVVFPYWYGQVLPVPQKVPDAAKYEQAVQLIAHANAVPFVGALTVDAAVKTILFCPNDNDCHPVPTTGYQWLVIAQNLISITLVFFIGLALRNYFKIK